MCAWENELDSLNSGIGLEVKAMPHDGKLRERRPVQKDQHTQQR